MPFSRVPDLFQRELVPGVRSHLFWGERLMFSFVEMAPHSAVPEHSHPHEQMGVVLEGAFELQIGDERRMLGPQDVFLIPGGVRHAAWTHDRPVRLLDAFSPPREDYTR
jgi:quercetin dioxygenase-like cupin family protein